MEVKMSKFANIVKCVVKEGHEQDYLNACRNFVLSEGQEQAYTIQTGDREFFFFGLWESEESLVKSRPEMISNLDTIRGYLEEISPELGVTDPHSGNVVIAWN